MQDASRQWQDQKQKWSLEVDMNATSVSVHEPSPVPRPMIYISNFICLSDLPSSPFTLSRSSSTHARLHNLLHPRKVPCPRRWRDDRYPVTDNNDRQLNV